jgi:hypothetical protein
VLWLRYARAPKNIHPVTTRQLTNAWATRRIAGGLNTIPSLNFACLAHHDPQLAAQGTQADQQFAVNPSVTLAHVRWTLRVQLWLVTILTVIIFNAGSSLPTQSAILLSPAWLQLQASPEALAHSRTNQKPQPRLSSANSGPTSSHGDNAQAAAPSSHAPSEARSLAKEGERAQRSVAERARGGGPIYPNTSSS